VLGAICASALELHLALSALIFPLCVLAALIVLDLFRPLQQPEVSISQGGRGAALIRYHLHRMSYLFVKKTPQGQPE